MDRKAAIDALVSALLFEGRLLRPSELWEADDSAYESMPQLVDGFAEVWQGEFLCVTPKGLSIAAEPLRAKLIACVDEFGASFGAADRARPNADWAAADLAMMFGVPELQVRIAVLYRGSFLGGLTGVSNVDKKTGLPGTVTLGVVARRIKNSLRDAVAEHLAPSTASTLPHDRESAAARESGSEPSDLSPGSMLGRYRIEDDVGGGRQGRVYRALDTEFDRHVAIKVLHDTSSENKERFLREARAMARLSHPNVATVYDGGAIGGRFYVAFEFIEGKTLKEWMLETDRTWQQILSAFIAAGEGLAHVHEHGLTHRDFKPENVMVAKNGRVKVVDFGLAKIDAHEPPTAEPDPLGETHLARLTSTGALPGTPAYMAPEQFNGEPASPSTDQYAFGVSLWTCPPSLRHA